MPIQRVENFKIKSRNCIFLRKKFLFNWTVNKQSIELIKKKKRLMLVIIILKEIKNFLTHILCCNVITVW